MNAWRRLESGILVPDPVAGEWNRVAKNRYVAHVDMLGMSGLILKNPKLAWEAVSKMTQAKKKKLSDSFTVGNRHSFFKDHVAAFTFSDTILLFTKSDDADDLRAILMVCLELFAQVLHGSIPVRIGVAHGQFVFNGDEGLFVGPPLVHAYRQGEAAQWIGAVLDKTVADGARKLQPEFLSYDRLPLVVDWDVPVKPGGTELHPVLSWPRSHRKNFAVALPISVEDFYRAFVQLFGPWSSLRSEDRRKYENTVSFVNATLGYRSALRPSKTLSKQK
jgi:hypothetical protein